MEEQKTEGEEQEGQEQEGKVTEEKKQQVIPSVQIDNLTLHGVFFYMVLNDWGQYAQWSAAPGTRTGNANGMVLGVKYRITASGNDLQ